MTLLVFTDLDGTLLDHHTYAWDEARPGLERLRHEGWPLVFVTSKTRAEVEVLRRALGHTDPYVVENGGGIFYPPGTHEVAPDDAEADGDTLVVTLGLPYSTIRRFVEDEGRALGVVGFGDVDDLEVARLTDLPIEDAARARARDFTEPFRLEEGAELERVREAARPHGIAITTGGRLHHLIGAEQNKGRAVRLLSDGYRKVLGNAPVTLGLGDGPNDLPMLEAVDHAVVMPVPGRPTLQLDRPGGRVARSPGPGGWAEAVLERADSLRPSRRADLGDASSSPHPGSSS